MSNMFVYFQQVGTVLTWFTASKYSINMDPDCNLDELHRDPTKYDTSFCQLKQFWNNSWADVHYSYFSKYLCSARWKNELLIIFN